MTGADTASIFTTTPVRPEIDPGLVAGLEAVRAVLPRTSAQTLGDLRRLLATGIPGRPPVDLTAGGQVVLEEREVPGPPDGPDVTLLVLRPAAPAGPLPLLYHIHAGGMTTGTRMTGPEGLLSYVAEGSAVLVSVEYRLAPEHPDPAPVDDCYAGLVWTAENAAELGVDPGRLIVIGSSAGGGLAAGTALMARDRGFPALSHQVLMCPMLDDRLRTASASMLDDEGIWDRGENLFGWTALLGERRGGPDVSPYAAPARADDLAGLPRTYLDVGSVDTFRDEVVHYAARLLEAGVGVDLHVWGGGFHGFDGIVPDAALSKAARAARAEFLRRAVGDGEPQA